MSAPLRRRLAFSAALVVAALLAGEVLSRALFADALQAWRAPPPPPAEDAPFMHGNPYLLWEFAPGLRSQRGHLVHINRLGLRGPEVQVPKPPGIRRLVSVGDSSVFGDGVGDDEVFGVQVAARLGPGVEHVNAAVPGYSTFQSINLLRMRVLALEPDLLVIASLWSDNNFDAFVDRELLTAYAAWQEGSVAKARRALDHSALFGVLDWHLRVSRRATAVRKVGFMLGSGQKAGPRRVAIQDYADNLETLCALAVGAGAEVIFLVLANREDLAPVPVGAPASGPAWEPYRQVMRDAAARHGAPVVEVPALFRNSGLSAEALFVDEMHPSAAGHRIIARELATLLTQRGWPDGGRVMGPGATGPVPRYVDPNLSPP
ncbi:SGNH/GDSL hydrolase family protein [Myxococcota bacterium]|nr:SGNH/GDSL hydrolase family protein [Myxococcota bacterium]